MPVRTGGANGWDKDLSEGLGRSAMSNTSTFLLTLFASCLFARLGFIPVSGHKHWKRACEIGAIFFLAVGLISLLWPEKNSAAPSVQNSTGSISSNSGIIAPGAMGPITQNNYAAPAPTAPGALPIRIMGFAVLPAVTGKIPELQMYLLNSGTHSLNIALKYEMF